MEDFKGVAEPPIVDHQPLIADQELQKVYGASADQCRPIAYLLVLLVKLFFYFTHRY